LNAGRKRIIKKTRAARRTGVGKLKKKGTPISEMNGKHRPNEKFFLQKKDIGNRKREEIFTKLGGGGTWVKT